MCKYHTYNLKYRPAGIGAVPSGGIVRINSDVIIDNGYGVITYNRELSEKECKDYELHEVFGLTNIVDR